MILNDCSKSFTTFFTHRFLSSHEMLPKSSVWNRRPVAAVGGAWAQGGVRGWARMSRLSSTCWVAGGHAPAATACTHRPAWKMMAWSTELNSQHTKELRQKVPYQQFPTKLPFYPKWLWFDYEPTQSGGYAFIIRKQKVWTPAIRVSAIGLCNLCRRHPDATQRWLFYTLMQIACIITHDIL